MGELEELYYKRIEKIQQVLSVISDDYQDLFYQLILQNEISELDELLKSLGLTKGRRKRNV